MEGVISVGSENWAREVIQSPQPVVVDFWAPSCAVCRSMEPIIHRMAHVFADQVRIAICNVAEVPDIAQRYHVMASPTLVFFKNGQVVDTLVGYLDEDHLTQKLNEVLEA
jgi:thioredoxin 1